MTEQWRRNPRGNQQVLEPHLVPPTRWNHRGGGRRDGEHVAVERHRGPAPRRAAQRTLHGLETLRHPRHALELELREPAVDRSDVFEVVGQGLALRRELDLEGVVELRLDPLGVQHTPQHWRRLWHHVGSRCLALSRALSRRHLESRHGA